MLRRKNKGNWQLAGEKLGEKLFDLGNIVGATMVFGQFISDKPFDLMVALVGVVLLIFLYGWSILFLIRLRR